MVNPDFDQPIFEVPEMRRIRHIHFVGVGGSGMCGIAEVFLNQGYAVSGSDIHDSATIARLQNLAIDRFRDRTAHEPCQAVCEWGGKESRHVLHDENRHRRMRGEVREHFGEGGGASGGDPYDNAADRAG